MINFKAMRAIFQLGLLLSVSAFLYLGFVEHLAGNKRWFDSLEKAAKPAANQNQVITITPQITPKTDSATTSQPASPNK